MRIEIQIFSLYWILKNISYMYFHLSVKHFSEYFSLSGSCWIPVNTVTVMYNTLVNVYVDLVVFARFASTS